MSNYTATPATEKPQLIMTIAITTLISGILNILWGLGLTAAIVLGTFFLGIVCAPVTILPAALGIFEVVYAVKLLSEPPQPMQPSQPLAIVEIVNIITGNIISAGVGILALVLYNDPIVKSYFARINGQVIPSAPPVTPKPAAPPTPVPPKSPAPKSRPVKKVANAKAATPKKTEKATKPKTPKKSAKAKKENSDESPMKPISDI